MHAPLIPITLAFIAGIVAAGAVALPLAWLAVAGLLAGLAAAQRRHRLAAMAGLWLLWSVLGMARMALWQAHPAEQLASQVPEVPEPVQLHGIVHDDPALLDGFGGPAHACLLLVRHVRGPAGWTRRDGRVRALIASPEWEPRYGDEVLLEGLWSRPERPGNPGGYDGAAALARQHAHGVLHVRVQDGVRLLRWGRGSRLVGAVWRLRRHWQRLIERAFNERDAGLLRSMLLGQRVALDEQLRDAFIDTGTMHLLVISGANVGMIALWLELLLRLLGASWRLRPLLIAAGLGVFCLLTGLQPPVLRATIMAWMALGALAVDRVVSWPNLTAAAALVILWAQPTQLYDPGCQLSFGAVISLLVFTPSWSAWLVARLAARDISSPPRAAGPPTRSAARLPPVLPPTVRQYAALSLSATSAVWIGLWPVLAWYFYLLAPVSLVANLLVAPLIGLLVCVGTALLAAATVFAGVLSGTGWILQALLAAVSRVVVACDGVPWGTWIIGRPWPALIAGYYLLLMVSLTRHRWRLTGGAVAACWALGLAVWAASAAGLHMRERRWLRMDVLDVGHGDSILIRTPNGKHLLIDSGTRDAGRFHVVPYLRSQGLRTLDALVLTHPDEDHIGGAAPVLDAVAVRQLLTNGTQDDTMSSRQIRALAAARRIAQTRVSSGMRLDAEPGLAIDVMHPPRHLVPGAPAAGNDNSVVLKLRLGRASVLLTGDLEEAGIPVLLGAPDTIGSQGPEARRPLRATILKVPHHGSRLGDAGERFFNFVQPVVSIISVGRAHHLPAAETVDRLQRTGTALYSTAKDGMVTVRTNGVTLHVTTYRSRRQQVILLPGTD